MEPLSNDKQEIKKVIYVIDRDPELRQRISDIFTTENVNLKMFASAEDFLMIPPLSLASGCLIFGTELTGMSAVDLLREFNTRQISLPFVVLGDEDDIPHTVSVFQAGAADFVSKPFADHKLWRVCMNRLKKPKL